MCVCSPDSAAAEDERGWYADWSLRFDTRVGNRLDLQGIGDDHSGDSTRTTAIALAVASK
jgi:hypothetical protein